ncbi:GDSL esterase/lipase At5g03610-like [Panicum virgatum]|uniref:GDSL esterase/lipase At5g03610-like n=1 Tax=Panicum virgatum TaxID=38727 RepID=UPI0019D64DB9|nr:GDSL esterase/lipase At5g03610-like [Panicum virgatum]
MATIVNQMGNAGNNGPRAEPQVNRFGDFFRTNPPIFRGSKDPLDADFWLNVIEEKLVLIECHFSRDCPSLRRGGAFNAPRPNNPLPQAQRQEAKPQQAPKHGRLNYTTAEEIPENAEVLMAKILGQDESPPPSRVRRSNPSGVNFAVGGSGVFDSAEAPSLRQQVDQFKSLLDNGIIDHGDLQRSVALVAVSTGRDYFQRINQETGSGDMRGLSGQVTDEIVDAVTRIKGLGVSKVLVNLLPTLSCLPWQSIASNYAHCDDQGNMLAGMHNSALRGKLESSPQDVYMLDLYTVFADIVQSNSGPQLQETHTPCSSNQEDPINGYCGQEDGNGREQYSLCDNPDSFFFWDYIHPTQAGWEAVIERLKGSIEEFLEESIEEFLDILSIEDIISLKRRKL